jgi:serine/threonine-protein kinase RsbW
MSEHRWSWTSRITFRSLPNAHLPHMKQILGRLKDLGWDGRDYFGVEIALEESLSNAIRHGNCCDESKYVVAECKLSEQRFWLRVRDEGHGFAPGAVPDCTADENLECQGGRGLALIKAYMTRVEHNKLGNCVTMEKIRSQAVDAPPSCRSCGTSPSPQE